MTLYCCSYYDGKIFTCFYYLSGDESLLVCTQANFDLKATRLCLNTFIFRQIVLFQSFDPLFWCPWLLSFVVVRCFALYAVLEDLIKHPKLL